MEGEIIFQASIAATLEPFPSRQLITRRKTSYCMRKPHHTTRLSFHQIKAAECPSSFSSDMNHEESSLSNEKPPETTPSESEHQSIPVASPQPVINRGVTFIDEVKNEPIAEIYYVESYKKYNAEEIVVVTAEFSNGIGSKQRM